MRITLEEAKKRITRSVSPLGAKTLPLSSALGCVIAQSLIAPMDQPPFPRSPYDGYALNSVDSEGASRQTPVSLKVVGRSFAGVPANTAVRSGEAVRIMTGGVIPEGADCVIAQENTDEGGETVRIFQTLKPFENYCHAGEDYRAGDVLAAAGERVSAAVCALCSGAGLAGLRVCPRPVVTVFSTGDEVRSPGEPLEYGQIYTSNTAYLSARLGELGLQCRELDTVCDELDTTVRAFEKALEYGDFVISTGGVSVGERDLVPLALERLGAEIVFHGVDVKPGMPSCLAVRGGKPILALSGNPFACAVSFELLARAVCAVLASDASLEARAVEARLAEDYTGKRNCRRFLSGRLTQGVVSMPKVQSNGRLRNMIGCNCLVELNAGLGALSRGDAVLAWML